jgi:hypothetical protein
MAALVLPVDCFFLAADCGDFANHLLVIHQRLTIIVACPNMFWVTI